MKTFLLSLIRAFFSGRFYREETSGWSTGRAFAFLLYLALLYTAGAGLGIMRETVKHPELLGPMNNQHVLIRMLNQAPHEWRMTNEGLGLFNDEGGAVDTWTFERYVHIDTTQQTDYVPPGEFFVVASKTLLWMPRDQQGRTFRFREMYSRFKSDVRMMVYRDGQGQFTHIDWLIPNQRPSAFTRADLARTYRTLKLFLFFLVFGILFTVFFLGRLLGALVLSAAGLLGRWALRRSVRYHGLFTLAAAVQAWAFLVDAIESLMPGDFAFPPFTKWAVCLFVLSFVLYRFYPAAAGKPAARSGPS